MFLKVQKIKQKSKKKMRRKIIIMYLVEGHNFISCFFFKCLCIIILKLQNFNYYIKPVEFLKLLKLFTERSKLLFQHP